MVNQDLPEEIAKVEKKDIINSLIMSTNEIKKAIDTHYHLVSSILEEKADKRILQLLFDYCPKGKRERRLEKAIIEAIDVLEDSRKAFKSKKLEALRKKLTSVLIDAN